MFSNNLKYRIESHKKLRKNRENAVKHEKYSTNGQYFT